MENRVFPPLLWGMSFLLASWPACGQERSRQTEASCTVQQAVNCGYAERCELEAYIDFSGEQRNPDALDGYPVCLSEPASGIQARGCVGSEQGYCFYQFNGPITREKVRGLLSFFESTASPPGRDHFPLVIDSNGGDISAAMELGRELRKRTATVVVENATCASACVLVLAGAVERSVFSTASIVIHRPYRAEPIVLGKEEAQRQYEARNAAIADYLREMNVPTSLLDAMLRVPSEAGYALSEDELFAFGLNSTDPVYEEERNAEEAHRLGISMSEYLSLRRQFNDCLSRAVSVGSCRRILNPTTTQPR